MKKIVIIESCGDCPNFMSGYPEWSDECLELQRDITWEDPIPEDCPLEAVKEEE